MKNASIARQMKQHFDSIRHEVESLQTAVLKKITKLADENLSAAKKYNETYLQTRKAEWTAKTKSEINALKKSTIQKVRAEYMQINSLLRDWLVSPMPEQCAAMLGAFARYDLTPTKSELEILTELSQGSYLGSRIVDGMGKSLGYVGDFKPIETLRREIDVARHDTENAIKNFAGIPDENHRLAADLLGLNLAENRNLIVFACGFLEGENSFSRLETELSDVMETEFTLLPSKRREIDALFADVPDSDRTDVAKRMIENDDSMADLLESYDKKLYLDALGKIASEKRAIAETLKASRAETDALADSAAQDAVIASTEATLANMRASRN